MIRIFFILLLFISVQSFSQDSSVIIHKDPRIDLLIRKQSEVNEIASRDERRIGKGFRLLVINTNKREDAIAAKTKVYTYFPELKAYLIYRSPFFRLKVGNFKERSDAEEYQKKLDHYFPNGVFIMSDMIELNLEKDQGEGGNDLLP